VIQLFTGFMICCTPATAAELRILVEKLDEQAARCGIAESALESRARLTLRSAGLTVKQDTAGKYLYINANVGELSSSQCVVSLMVQIRESKSVPPSASF